MSVIPYFAAFSEQGGLLFRSGQGDSCFSTMIQSGARPFCAAHLFLLRCTCDFDSTDEQSPTETKGYSKGENRSP